MFVQSYMQVGHHFVLQGCHGKHAWHKSILTEILQTAFGGTHEYFKQQKEPAVGIYEYMYNVH